MDPSYELRELLNDFPAITDKPVCIATPPGPRSGCGSGALGSNLYERLPLNRVNVALVQSMLDALPVEYADDFGQWLRVGFALHHFDEGAIGLTLWKRFSERCPSKAKDMDFETRWAGFSRDYAGDRITLGWLTAHAKEHGWCAPCRWDYSTKSRADGAEI